MKKPDVLVINKRMIFHYGLQTAVILEYLIRKLKYTKERYLRRDGKRWMQLSVVEIHFEFPFFSTGQIRSAIKILQIRGAIRVEKLESGVFDQRRWYTVITSLREQV